MKNIYELQCRYDARKSFYGKANVLEQDNSILLFSYGTCVCVLYDDKIYLNQHAYDESTTTMRHIKEFLKQYKEIFMESKEIHKNFNNKTFLSFYDIPIEKTMEILGV